MITRTVAFALLLVLAPAEVLGQSGAIPASGEGGERWYGGQTLAVDGIGLSLGLLGLAGSDNVFWVGSATVLLGAPVVHAAHGNGRGVALSLAMRVFLPLIGAGIGGAMVDGCDPDCHPPDFTGVIGGAVVGLVAASVIDAAWLARARSRRRDGDGLTWAPRVGVTSNGISAGIGGMF